MARDYFAEEDKSAACVSQLKLTDFADSIKELQKFGRDVFLLRTTKAAFELFEFPKIRDVAERLKITPNALHSRVRMWGLTTDDFRNSHATTLDLARKSPILGSSVCEAEKTFRAIYAEVGVLTERLPDEVIDLIELMEWL